MAIYDRRSQGRQQVNEWHQEDERQRAEINQRAKAFNKDNPQPLQSGSISPYTTTSGTFEWDIPDSGRLHIEQQQRAKEQPLCELPFNEVLYGHHEEQKPSKPKGDQPMEILFNVIVVSKDRDVLLEQKVVAVDEAEAQLAIDIHSCLKARGLKLRDVTVLVNDIGEVKVRKEVQKVKMVDKDEE